MLIHQVLQIKKKNIVRTKTHKKNLCQWSRLSKAEIYLKVLGPVQLRVFPKWRGQKHAQTEENVPLWAWETCKTCKKTLQTKWIQLPINKKTLQTKWIKIILYACWAVWEPKIVCLKEIRPHGCNFDISKHNDIPRESHYNLNML